MRISISKKIYLIVAAIILITASVSIVMSVSSIRKAGKLEIENLRQTVYEEKREKLASLIQTAYTILSESDDPEEAMQMIGSLRYGNDGKGYFWINDMQPKMIMHPFKPQLNGKDISGVKDPEGKYLFIEMVDICRKHGSGIVKYMWSMPGSDIPVPKLSFVKHYAKWDWIIGTGVYINDIDTIIAEKQLVIHRHIKYMLLQTVLLFIIIAGLLLGLTYLAVSRTIIRPLNRVRNGLEDIAYGDGDLTRELPVSPVNCSTIKNCTETDCLCHGKETQCWGEAGSFSLNVICPSVVSGRIKSCKECTVYQQVVYDEITSLSTFFNIFVRKLRTILENVTNRATTVAASAESMYSLSREMKEETALMNTRINTITDKTGEMTVSMNSVSASSDEASVNVSHVSTAAEEMSITISEIAGNSEKAREVTESAVEKVKRASDKVNELGDAARKINRVTETITEISEQTNLLALNATIEASRAGDAGRGFAVVADEIKALARQTAEATFEIKQQIRGIQGSMAGTIEEIDEISGVITGVNDIVSTIATSVEEQSITTQEIAENISHASSGIEAVTGNVGTTSGTAGLISTEIEEVNTSIGSIATGSSKVNDNASDLSSAIQELKDEVGKFKIS